MHISKHTFLDTIYALGLFFFALLILQCSSVNEEDKEVLAKINELCVTTTHFENAFKEYYYRTGQVLSPDISTKKAILDNEFNTYVMAVFAQDLDLDESEYAQAQQKAIERRVINEEYLNQVILADISVTDNELEDYFVRFNSQLRASHLYARTKDEIDALYKRLNSGESFDELAKEVFTNAYMANNGGDIGRFTTDDLDIAFENMAFSMNVNEISEPVKTEQGYSIIKLTERVTKPVLTEYEFNQKRDQLYSYAYKKKEEIETRRHLSDFLDALVMDEEVSSSLWDYIESNYEGMQNKDMEFISNLGNGDQVLASSNDFDFSIADFKEEYVISSFQMLNSIQNEVSFHNFVKGVAYRTYLFTEAQEQGIHDQVLVLDSIDETYYHFLADEANYYLQSSIENTQAELYNEFQSSRENYIRPLEINLARIVVDSQDKAELVQEELANGVLFEDLVIKYSTKNEDLFTKGELGFESIKNYGFLETQLAQLEVGDVSEIIRYQPNEFHIYMSLGRIESAPLTFAQSRDLVNDFLTKKKLQELRASTVDQVKEKHNAIIDLQKLNELTIQI